MANVLNKITKKYKESVNTPDYDNPTGKYWDNGNWIINPDKNIIDTVPEKHWIIENNTLREMTQDEKDELEYNTNSTIYSIATGVVLTKQDGRYHEGNLDSIINPTMPENGWEYGKVVGGELLPMTEEERAQYDWTHKSEVYIISTKELLWNQNADDYIESMDAIVNPEMPSGADMIVEPQFTEVVEGVIVEMSKEDKDAIKAAEDEAKAVEDEAKEVENAEKIRKEIIAAEIANKYPIEEQIRITFKLAMGILQPEDDEAVGLANALNEAESKYTA